MDPLVSTVIPTYNRTVEIVRSVGSVLAQTYPADRHEVIVVDDGSKNPAATEAALAPFGPRVRLLKKANGGVSSARNHGALAAKGDLIAFLDSDDVWTPDKLRKQVDYLQAHPECGMVLCDMDIVDPDGNFLQAAPRRAQFPRDGMILSDVLLHPRLGPSTMLIQRTALDKVGLFDESLRTAEDVDFILRVARCVPIGVVEESLTKYTRNSHESNALSADKSSWDDYMRVMRGFVARYANEIDPAVGHQAMLQACLRNARGLIGSGRGREGLKLLAEAARHARRPADFVEMAKIGARAGRSAATAIVRVVRPAA